MVWYISPTVNNGYPYNTDFAGIIPNYLIDGKYNYSFWRIDTTGKINNGYPYNYYLEQWIGGNDEKPSGEGDIINTDGYTQQHAGNIASANRSNLNFDNNSMLGNDSLSAASAAVSLNALVSNQSGPSFVRSALNAFPVDHPAQATIVSEFFGANIYNCVVLCKMYPFSIPVSGTQMGVPTMGITLCEDHEFRTAATVAPRFNFGVVNLNITQGWEITQNKYYIYLPYSGIYTIPIVGNEAIELEGYVDLNSGIIDYAVFVNNQIILTASGKIGVDIPINAQMGAQLQNALSNMVSIGSSLISSVASSATEGGVKLPTITGGNLPVQSMQTASGTSALCFYQKPRIIIRKAKMYNDGYGYGSTNGYTSKRYYSTLSDLSGEFVKCINYISTSNKATEAEKSEIKNLMESGVII